MIDGNVKTTSTNLYKVTVTENPYREESPEDTAKLFVLYQHIMKQRTISSWLFGVQMC